MPAAERPRVCVVGLGPAGPEHVTPAARRSMASSAALYLRTLHHPAAADIAATAGSFDVAATAGSFDYLYDSCPTFEDVYRQIVEALVTAATAAAEGATTGAEAGLPVAYAVPGSPLVAERTVELLVADPRVDVAVVPALSFLDLAWARLGVDPVAASAKLVDAASFSLDAADDRGPFLVAQCWSSDVLSKVKLSFDPEDLGAEPQVTLLHHLGLDDEVVRTVGWWEMDQVVTPDHLTSVWIPRLGEPIGGDVARLETLVRTLRSECPWDRKQTHSSLVRHLIEECYEAADTIADLAEATRDGEELGSASTALCEELGDVLFQVVFHSVLASEEGLFTLNDVARGVRHKLVGRHPHVFGDVVAETPEAVAANWEVLKKAEKGRKSVTEGIPSALPSLALAAKLQKKALAVGLAEPDLGELEHGVRRLAEPLEAVAVSGRSAVSGAPGSARGAASALTAEQFGALLFAVADLARRAGVDAEEATRAAALRLRDRIVEAELTQSEGVGRRRS